MPDSISTTKSVWFRGPTSRCRLTRGDLHAPRPPAATLTRAASPAQAQMDRISLMNQASSQEKFGHPPFIKHTNSTSWDPSLGGSSPARRRVFPETIRTAAWVEIHHPVQGVWDLFSHTRPGLHPIQMNLVASGVVYIWDLHSPSKPYTPTPGTCDVLAGASNMGYTVVWDFRGKREVVALAYGCGSGFGGGMSNIKWHPDNPTCLVTASEDDQSPIIMLWDLRNARAPGKILTGHKKEILFLYSLPRGGARAAPTSPPPRQDNVPVSTPALRPERTPTDDAVRFDQLKVVLKTIGLSKRHIAQTCQLVAVILTYVAKYTTEGLVPRILPEPALRGEQRRHGRKKAIATMAHPCNEDTIVAAQQPVKPMRAPSTRRKNAIHNRDVQGTVDAEVRHTCYLSKLRDIAANLGYGAPLPQMYAPPPGMLPPPPVKPAVSITFSAGCGVCGRKRGVHASHGQVNAAPHFDGARSDKRSGTIDWTAAYHDPNSPRRQHIWVYNQMIEPHFRAGAPERAVELLEHWMTSTAAASRPTDVSRPVSFPYTVSHCIIDSDAPARQGVSRHLLAQTERPCGPYEARLAVLRPDAVARVQMFNALPLVGSFDDLNHMSSSSMTAWSRRLPELDDAKAAETGAFLMHVVGLRMDVPRLVCLWEPPGRVGGSACRGGALVYERHALLGIDNAAGGRDADTHSLSIHMQQSAHEHFESQDTDAGAARRRV
ncbi:hypothetical protein B0H11DRAFT_2216067 [Mycena galericulata]|nr:hypothetical protein B0H11DRAFT_2216067 [Mycena galericulata]